MSSRFIDMENYSRRAHFDYFRSLAYPYVGTTVPVDVTDALRYSRARQRSFNLTMIHAAALAADEVKEFRQRIRGDGIVEYGECPTSHIELMPDQTYCYCTLRHHMDLDSYYMKAEEARQSCRTGGIDEDSDADSMYFVSSLPWLPYTSLVQPAAGGDESNPRFTWGRYEENGKGRVVMPFSVLVHHALADGVHLARFYECLDAEIGKYGKLI